MQSFSESDDLEGSEFVGVDLRRSRFVSSDLSDVVMRGVEVRDVEIDSPWLFDGDGFLRVNGVDVLPFVEAELNRRFPGRGDRQASDPQGLRHAWAALERTWAATLERVATMPVGTVDASVAGEWSFAQTLRHLTFATDVWLRKAILGIEQPYHPLGLMHEDPDADPPAQLTTATPSYEEVLAARTERVTMVRDYLDAVTSDELPAPRNNPHDPRHQETVLSCLHTILDEEWEHHRYAVRDLDALESQG